MAFIPELSTITNVTSKLPISKLATVPTKINVITGTGVPGGFFSGNYKKVSQNLKNKALGIKSNLTSNLPVLPKLPTLPSI